MEAQNANRKRTRDERRGPQRSQNSPKLLDFAPHLSQLGSASSSKKTQVADREEESPFRSPLQKSWRERQDSTPHHSRGGHSAGRRGSGQRPNNKRLQTPSSASSQNTNQNSRGQHSSQNGRGRVRKCLWADEEEEEAACNGSPTEESLPPREPPKTPTKEQIARRQKDLDYGKATDGYKNYLQRVPKDQRGNMCPKTPEKTTKVSRRSWDQSIRKWRRNLHQWDVPAKLADTDSPTPTPAVIQTRPADRAHGNREYHARPTQDEENEEPIDEEEEEGYTDEEEEGEIGGEQDFPPLWAAQMDASERESVLGSPLDKCVSNLSLGDGRRAWSNFRHQDNAHAKEQDSLAKPEEEDCTPTENQASPAEELEELESTPTEDQASPADEQEQQQ